MFPWGVGKLPPRRLAAFVRQAHTDNVITFAALAAAAVLRQGGAAPAADTPAQHNARMAWWRDARFGMFIHWGLYSIPAGKWGNGTNYGEWLREEAHVPVGEYEKLQGQFNPTKFDANAWAKMAKDAGMKYVVITTKHHDGFNLFPSNYTDWSVKNTPFHRDVMKELSTAVRKQGLTMGWYHSIMDWHHPDYLPRRSWEGASRPADGADFNRFVTYLHNEVRQILTNYGPIGVMWFDGDWESTWNPALGRDLYDVCRTAQPNVIVNDRISGLRSGGVDPSKKEGDYGTPEQYIPDTGLSGRDWETCMTMNDHWGYNAADNHWKSSQSLIHNLVDICSKGGNYLLNIGPRADGTFPPEAVSRLKDIGKWMHTNSESIYGTTASQFEALPWGRSTTKRVGGDTALYLQVFDYPEKGRLVVPGLANDPTRVRLLGGKGLGFERSGGDLIIYLPPKASSMETPVVRVDVAGRPTIYVAPKIVAPTDMIVGAVPVSIEARRGQEVRYTLDGSMPDANSPVYSGPLSVRKDTTVKAATFVNGKLVSSVTTASFRTVTPLPAVSVDSAEPGLTVETYSGDFEKMPNFDSLTSASSATTDDIALPMQNGHPQEHVAQRFRGYIEAPEDGVYTFTLTSDDGGKLWIDGKVVADADGLHSAQTVNGTIALAKGRHRIVLGYFNGTGDAALKLGWGLVGREPHPSAASDFSH